MYNSLAIFIITGIFDFYFTTIMFQIQILKYRDWF